MRVLLIVYMGLYALFVGGILLVYLFVIPKGEKRHDPSWETPLDVILLLTGFAGMWLLATENEAMKASWQVVAPVMVALQLFMNIRGRAKQMREQNDQPDTYSRMSDVMFLLFMVPSLGLNLAYAFG